MNWLSKAEQAECPQFLAAQPRAVAAAALAHENIMTPATRPGPTRRRLVQHPLGQFFPRGEAAAIAWRALDPSRRVRFLTAVLGSVTTGFPLQLPPD
jgi:hypothetical protein